MPLLAALPARRWCGRRAQRRQAPCVHGIRTWPSRPSSGFSSRRTRSLAGSLRLDFRVPCRRVGRATRTWSLATFTTWTTTGSPAAGRTHSCPSCAASWSWAACTSSVQRSHSSRTKRDSCGTTTSKILTAGMAPSLMRRASSTTSTHTRASPPGRTPELRPSTSLSSKLAYSPASRRCFPDVLRETLSGGCATHASRPKARRC
mmetsp:Transcript_49652/g.111621  ORF Transcript_49652/g.111621 Transcript_49652/m.111621 type:complete len:204 (+) Transcript_49652:54-665(+)